MISIDLGNEEQMELILKILRENKGNQKQALQENKETIEDLGIKER